MLSLVITLRGERAVSSSFSVSSALGSHSLYWCETRKGVIPREIFNVSKLKHQAPCWADNGPMPRWVPHICQIRQMDFSEGEAPEVHPAQPQDAVRLSLVG